MCSLVLLGWCIATLAPLRDRTKAAIYRLLAEILGRPQTAHRVEDNGLAFLST